MEKTKLAYEREMGKFTALEAKFERMQPGYTQSKEHLRVRRDFYDHLRTKYGKITREDQWLENRMAKGARNHVDRQINRGWLTRNSRNVGRSTGRLLFNTGKLAILAPIAILTAAGALLARGGRFLLNPAKTEQPIAAIKNRAAMLPAINGNKQSPAMRTVHKAAGNVKAKTEQVIKKLPQHKRSFQPARSKGLSR